MLEEFTEFIGRFLCAVVSLAAVAVLAAECAGDAYDRYDPYAGATPEDERMCVEYDNTLPPTYCE